MNKKDSIQYLLDRLTNSGSDLLKTEVTGRGNLKFISDREGLMRWAAELKLFVSMAGCMIAHWRDDLSYSVGSFYSRDLRYVLATLGAVQFALDEGLLTKYEDLVTAEIFSDLFDQADYLLEKNYYLAAGVIYRAVLEERSRKMCERHNCLPSKSSPTINDYNVALYKTSPPTYDKGVMQHITSLATVGNDAAHNNSALKVEDVRRLQTGLRDFLGSSPI